MASFFFISLRDPSCASGHRWSRISYLWWSLPISLWFFFFLFFFFLLFLAHGGASRTRSSTAPSASSGPFVYWFRTWNWVTDSAEIHVIPNSFTFFSVLIHLCYGPESVGGFFPPLFFSVADVYLCPNIKQPERSICVACEPSTWGPPHV